MQLLQYFQFKHRKLADIAIKLPGSPKGQSEGDYKPVHLMGSLVEQALLLFYDAVILRFKEKKKLDPIKCMDDMTTNDEIKSKM
ncbi:hypothetical protein ACFTQL_10700 [Peribacillus butanolivorans]|uniref:hypothetical protein n=1 Tax=Peribacillus butanolivorans TaxID=421767 RepID=UPI00362D4AE4